MIDEIQPLLWVDKSELPPEALALLDPDVPLPADTIFFPDSPNYLSFGLGALACLFFGVVTVGFALTLPGAFETSVGEGVASVVVTLLFGFVTEGFRRVGRKSLAILRALRQGRFREGLFFTMDRVVFWTTDRGLGQRCFQVPRVQVLDVTLHAMPGSGSRKSYPLFSVAQEQGEPLSLAAFAMYGGGVQAVVSAGQTWMHGAPSRP